MAARRREPAGLALAKSLASCTSCHGLGRSEKRGVTCRCVYRNISSECLERYLNLVEGEAEGRDCFMEISQHGHLMATMKASEYIADFDMAARRALDETEKKVLELYFLKDLIWRQCALRLQIDRGTFFHAVYRTMERLGRELALAEIWPLDAYFGARRVKMRMGAGGAGAPEVPNFRRSALAAA